MSKMEDVCVCKKCIILENELDKMNEKIIKIKKINDNLFNLLKSIQKNLSYNTSLYNTFLCSFSNFFFRRKVIPEVITKVNIDSEVD